MEIICHQSVLSEAITKVGKIISDKVSLTILKGIYMEITDEGLTVIGSNLDSGIRVTVPANSDEGVTVKKPGKIILPKSIVEIIKKLSGDITISTGDNMIIKVKTDKSLFELPGMDPKEYPNVFKNKNEGQKITMTGKQFLTIVSKTFFCCAMTETRPILQSIFFKQLSNNSYSLTATDSHRLANIVVKDLSVSTDKGLDCAVPGLSLQKMIQVFDLDEEVQLLINETQLLVKNNTITYCARLLEGNYPDTSRLLPNDYQTEVKLNRKELINALEQVSILSKEGAAKIVNDGLMLTVSSVFTEIGSGKIDLAYLDYSGEDITISFSIRFVLDALKSYQADEVYIKLCGSSKPFVIQSDDTLETQLVLPIRTA